MERYLIETPHTAVDCRMIINQLYSQGYLYNFEWGCPDGEHSGWAIVEAENEQEARMMVPSIVRKDARVVRIYRFDVDGSGKFHAS